MKKFFLALVLLGLGAWAFGEPVVDGKIGAGEYAHTLAVIDGSGLLSWSGDAKGGLTVAFKASTHGWVAVGLGAKRMSGASIYMGFFASDGKAVFSEQKGKGHNHSASGVAAVDASAVVITGGDTVLEFHLPAGKLPFTGKSVPFIVSFGPTADLVSFHGQNYDSGTMSLP